MPAPDIQTLYDFETQIESAFVGILTADLLPLGVQGVFATRDFDNMPTPRVEIEFVPGAANSQRYGSGGGMTGQPYRENPNSFGGLLVLRIVTTRPDDGQRADHGPIRGMVRFLCSPAANRVKKATNLPYLQILDLVPAGSVPRFIDEKQQDVTELQYQMIFAINNDAWPT